MNRLSTKGAAPLRALAAKLMLILTVAGLAITAAAPAQANNAGIQGYGLKIFRVESALYPFVHVYMRTFDQDMNPLVNLNVLNIGVMIEGRAYDP